MTGIEEVVKLSGVYCSLGQQILTEDLGMIKVTAKLHASTVDEKQIQVEQRYTLKEEF